MSASLRLPASDTGPIEVPLVNVPGHWSAFGFPIPVAGTWQLVSLNFSTPLNASIGDGEGLGTITDDDLQPALSVGDTIVVEGSVATANATVQVRLSAPIGRTVTVAYAITAATFSVTRSPASGRAVTVNYGTGDGTATEPTHYTSNSGTLSHGPSRRPAGGMVGQWPPRRRSSTRPWSTWGRCTRPRCG